jgi:hypothetical protein
MADDRKGWWDTIKAHVGDDPVVKNNPVCQGPIALDTSKGTANFGCDLVGKYVGFDLDDNRINYPVIICEIDLWTLGPI